MFVEKSAKCWAADKPNVYNNGKNSFYGISIHSCSFLTKFFNLEGGFNENKQFSQNWMKYYS